MAIDIIRIVDELIDDLQSLVDGTASLLFLRRLFARFRLFSTTGFLLLTFTFNSILFFLQATVKFIITFLFLL